MKSEMLTKSYKNHPLAEYTTLKIGGKGEIVFFPESTEELVEIRNNLVANGIPVTIIGAGSNLLISSKGISGGVIFTTNLKDCEISDSGKVKVRCGLKSAVLAKLIHERSLSGLEFLIGIPGTIGGAVTMNSSAHGQAIEDTIQYVDILDINTGKVRTLNKAELQLSYRSSFVHNTENIILNATFQLQKGDPDEILKKMEFHLNYRKQNHPPLTEPNAGSTFRNPSSTVFVGQLFEQLGAKEWVEGGARVSSKHANFILNTGGATSLDVSRLMYRMYNGVKERLGYDLIAEIRFVGDKTEEEEKIWENFTVH